MYIWHISDDILIISKVNQPFTTTISLCCGMTKIPQYILEWSWSHIHRDPRGSHMHLQPYVFSNQEAIARKLTSTNQTLQVGSIVTLHLHVHIYE